jgi:hypothetical protein
LLHEDKNEERIKMQAAMAIKVPKERCLFNLVAIVLVFI